MNLAPVGTPFASLTPAPPNAIVVLASLRLAVVGPLPLPLPLSGGGQVLQGLSSSSLSITSGDGVPEGGIGEWT